MPELRGWRCSHSLATTNPLRAALCRFARAAPEFLGEGELKYVTSEGSFQVAAGAFFQTNRFLVDELLSIVLGDRQGQHALDLYARGPVFGALVAPVRARHGGGNRTPLGRFLARQQRRKTTVGSLTSQSQNEWIDGGIDYQKANFPKMQLATQRLETYDDATQDYNKLKEALTAYPTSRACWAARCRPRRAPAS